MTILFTPEGYMLSSSKYISIFTVKVMTLAQVNEQRQIPYKVASWTALTSCRYGSGRRLLNFQEVCYDS